MSQCAQKSKEGHKLGVCHPGVAHKRIAWPYSVDSHHIFKNILQ